MLANIGSILFKITPETSICVKKVNLFLFVINSLYIIPSVPNKLVLLYLPVASNKSKYLLIPLAILLTDLVFIISWLIPNGPI